MALTPDTNKNLPDPAEKRKAAEEDALLREVDDAVREDALMGFLRKYGKILAGVVVLGLAALAFYLWSTSSSEGDLEKTTEEMVKVIDNIDAGNFDTADTALARIIEEADGGSADLAKLLRAGIAMERDRQDEAMTIYEAVAADENAPQPLRDLATMRIVNASFDTMEPQAVIDRLQTLAQPGNPWFPSAAELTAMAYLELGKEDLAGPIFAEISRDEKAPAGVRSRTRQMAGLLGVDAVDDIEEAIESVAQSDAPAAQ